MDTLSRLKTLAGLGSVQEETKVTEAGNIVGEFNDVIRAAISSAEEAGAYGDVRDETVVQAYDAFSKGDFESAAEMILADFAGQDGGEVSAIDGIYQDLVSDLEYIAKNTNEAEVLDASGKTVKTFSRKEHGADYKKQASAYLEKHFDTLKEEDSLSQVAAWHMAQRGHKYEPKGVSQIVQWQQEKLTKAKKKKKKTDEGAERDRRASSKYGPASNDYDSGYSKGYKEYKDAQKAAAASRPKTQDRHYTDFEYIAKNTNEAEVNEAVGEFAEAYFDLIDRVGGDASLVNNEALAWLGTDAKHEITGNDDDYEDYMSADDVAGEITRYMSGDEIKEFVDHFERHYDLDSEVEEGNQFSGELAKAKAAGNDEFEVDGKKYQVKESEACPECGEDPCVCESCNEEVEEISEAPTMDTTQLVTIMRNAGLSEETITQKLEEWANTPEGVGETEPREHGGADNYAMAQAVNLSLKKYLDAQDMQVSVNESHTGESLTEAYRAYKGEVVEAAKPDFADIDGDGDEEESMKKAAKDKEEKEDVKESDDVSDVDRLKRLSGL
jgi:hypothetical protein